jgi:hypothetical protein
MTEELFRFFFSLHWFSLLLFVETTCQERKYWRFHDALGEVCLSAAGQFKNTKILVDECTARLTARLAQPVHWVTFIFIPISHFPLFPSYSLHGNGK